MAVIEQFMFTAAEIDGRRGYQTVARSPGIDDDTVDDLAMYMYPVGIISSDFASSRSLLEIPGGRIVYIAAENAGTGYDHRGHTICTHVLILDAGDFGAAGYDSKALEPLCSPDMQARGVLPAIEADLAPLLAPSSDGRIMDVLGACMAALLAGKRVALLADGAGIIQNMLRLFPGSSRLVPFSTVVERPEKQSRYRLMSVPRTVPTGIPGDVEVVRPGAGREIPEDVAYYVRLLRDGRMDATADVGRMFDEAPGLDAMERLGLACDRLRHAEAGSDERRNLVASIRARAERLGCPVPSEYVEAAGRQDPGWEPTG
ncbi:MAG: hypothetical protein MPJ08_00960 [Nitrosopumilus sp.]|nr:hypothetical protein [Nitrosopumilus sp.]